MNYTLNANDESVMGGLALLLSDMIVRIEATLTVNYCIKRTVMIKDYSN